MKILRPSLPRINVYETNSFISDAPLPTCSRVNSHKNRPSPIGHKVIFYADPLERLFWAWKCLCAPERDRRAFLFMKTNCEPSPEHCLAIFGKRTVSFTRAVQSIWKLLVAGRLVSSETANQSTMMIGSHQGSTVRGINFDPWR